MIKLFILLSVLLSNNAFAQVKICEIIYGIKDSTSLAQKMRDLNQSCTVIGFEHDKDNNPLIDKPIYSCCKA